MEQLLVYLQHSNRYLCASRFLRDQTFYYSTDTLINDHRMPSEEVLIILYRLLYPIKFKICLPQYP